MKYKNFIFDLYGTLADIWTDEACPALWERTALWYSENGAGWQGPALQARYLALCEKEQKSLPDPLGEIELRRVFAALFSEKDVQADAALVEETACFFRITSLKKLERYPWVERVFGKIRAAGGRIFLLSNAQACFTEKELRALGLAKAFDGIVISSDAGVRKPSPRIMERLLAAWGLDPAECVMTGNDPATDIAIARGAGMDSLYLKTETSPRVYTGLPPTCAIEDGRFERIESCLGLK